MILATGPVLHLHVPRIVQTCAVQPGTLEEVAKHHIIEALNATGRRHRRNRSIQGGGNRAGLQREGHDVVAVMTRGAQNFVGPLTFEAITRRAVVTDQWAPGTNADIEHISLASSIGLLLVAPATAHVLARLAHGLADDFLTSLYLATRAPVLVAPAMNTNMFDHEAVRANLATLRARGVHVVEPGEGYLACGWIGKGRLAEPDEVVRAAQAILSSARTLAERRVVVSAGPTYEDLDPVRFIGNRSSGRMGMAIAAEAARRGAAVTLVLGPSPLDPPPGVDVVRVRSYIGLIF